MFFQSSIAPADLGNGSHLIPFHSNTSTNSLYACGSLILIHKLLLPRAKYL